MSGTSALSWCFYDSLGAVITEHHQLGESAAEMGPLVFWRPGVPERGAGQRLCSLQEASALGDHFLPGPASGSLSVAVSWPRPPRPLSVSTRPCPSRVGVLLILQRHQLSETVPGGPVVEDAASTAGILGSVPAQRLRSHAAQCDQKNL